MNLRPTDYESAALTTELLPPIGKNKWAIVAIEGLFVTVFAVCLFLVIKRVRGNFLENYSYVCFACVSLIKNRTIKERKVTAGMRRKPS